MGPADMEAGQLQWVLLPPHTVMLASNVRRDVSLCSILPAFAALPAKQTSNSAVSPGETCDAAHSKPAHPCVRTVALSIRGDFGNLHSCMLERNGTIHRPLL